jgi:hypothetical protein
MPYIPPEEVISPKASWRLVDVIIDKGPENCAYAIGMWDRKRRIGFRWNGSDGAPLGNPQSRGLPTWVMLDTALNRAVVKLVEKLNPDKTPIVRAFLAMKVEE